MIYRQDFFISFSSTLWQNYKEKLLIAIDNEISHCTDDYVLNVNEDEYVSFLLDKFTLEPLTIDKNTEEVANPKPIRVEMPNYGGRYAATSIYREGYSFEITYSFTGSSELFKVRPNPYQLSSYKITVDQYSSKVSFVIDVFSMDPSVFEQEKKSAFTNAFSNIENINHCVREYNNSLKSIIRKKFSKAKEQRLAKTGFFAAIKVKKTTYAPTTYGVPTIKKKKALKPQDPRSKVYFPEPCLDIETYENIIAEMNQLGLSMERKPSLYLNKDEEGLRDLFLALLETRFEGVTATGETFNHCGKTDILLKNAKDGSNLFIAECKFWHGPKHFSDAINQLLGYLTWRDSKSALVVFVNGTNFTTVLDSIYNTITLHPCYKSSNIKHGKSSNNYIFKLPQDHQKEVYLEVMAFNFDKNK